MTDDSQIKIIHRKNRLKDKVAGSSDSEGGGFIAPELIANAQAVIDNSKDLYKKELADTLHKLIASWNEFKQSSDDKHRRDLERYANHIKDIAGTYQYDIMAHFGRSLCAFSDKLLVEKLEHQNIVQAHIDVITIAYQKDLKRDDTPQAQELKDMVSQAINKHVT
jgi:hypothetical protein